MHVLLIPIPTVQIWIPKTHSFSKRRMSLKGRFQSMDKTKESTDSVPKRELCQLFWKMEITEIWDFFVQAFRIVVDSWKFSMLLLYILWDDWPIFMISNQQLQQELEYTPLKAWLSQLVNFKNAIWTWGHFRRTICNKILF